MSSYLHRKDATEHGSSPWIIAESPSSQWIDTVEHLEKFFLTKTPPKLARICMVTRSSPWSGRRGGEGSLGVEAALLVLLQQIGSY